MSAFVLIWMISSFRWEIWFKVILFFLKSSGMYGICEYFYGLTGFGVMAYPIVALCRDRPCKATNDIDFIG